MRRNLKLMTLALSLTAATLMNSSYAKAKTGGDSGGGGSQCLLKITIYKRSPY